MKLLLIFCSLLLSNFALANTECRVKSRINPELEHGINRTILCSSVIEELVENEIYSGDGGSIVLTVTSQEMYAVNLRFKLTNTPQNAMGRGTLFWNPDGSEFVIRE